MYKSVLDVILELRAEPSKNKKVEIIRENKDVKNFLQVAELALSPLVTFGIKQIPEYDVGKGLVTLDRAFRILILFSNRTYTGNKATKQLRQLLESLEFDDAQCIELIINKSLDCGASISTFNKALECVFVKEYAVNTYDKFTEDTKHTIHYPAYAQVKMDGLRVNVRIEDGKISWFTRNGRSFNLSEKINNQVRAITHDSVLDGELLASDGNGGYLSRKKGNGIVNSMTRYDGSLSTLLSKPSTKTILKKIDNLTKKYNDNLALIRFVVWDNIPIDVFDGRDAPKTYKEVY